MESNRLLKGSEVAERLSVSRALAYRLMTRGQIRCVRFGRTVRCRLVDLENFIQNNMTNKDDSNAIISSSYQESAK
jgi:excisionase family DNA binding protein